MPTADTAQHLRLRATELRRFAHRIETCAALAVHRHADDTTWLGPTAQQCHHDLLAWRQRLLARVADLRVAARRLERLAETIAAASATPVGGR
jgi:hypothetical protein